MDIKMPEGPEEEQKETKKSKEKSFEKITLNNQTCCICNTIINDGYLLNVIKDKNDKKRRGRRDHKDDKDLTPILSGGYGEFENTLSITKNMTVTHFICESCFYLFKYRDKHNGKFYNYISILGIVAGYNDKTQENSYVVLTIPKKEKGTQQTIDIVSYDEKTRIIPISDKERKKEIASILFNPPAGYFFVAFNRHFLKRGSRGTHFLHNAVINYNAGKCDKYILTVLDKRILFDINKARQYMQVLPYVKHLPLYLKTGNDKLVDIKKATKTMTENELKLILQDMRRNYDLAVFTRGLI